MEKLKYLNVGCGSKFHKTWYNIDMVSFSPYVKKCNVFKGMPYPDNYFEVVYHSQVLEHIPKEKAEGFIKECFRVLKPGGTIRIVVPDLENIVDEYKKHLKENLESPNDLAEANYNFILLELYDQAVRNSSGGEVAKLLKEPELINESYVMGRMGHVGLNMRRNNSMTTKEKIRKVLSSREMQRKVLHKIILRKVKDFFSTKSTRIGAFRLGGEIHQWMYDKYSLSKLLNRCGFMEMKVKSPFESDIPDWKEYELDIKDGVIFDPTSLFMEARKPV